MSQQLACPDLDKLERLACGGLAHGEAAALGEHVRTCSACAKELDRLWGTIPAAVAPGSGSNPILPAGPTTAAIEQAGIGPPTRLAPAFSDMPGDADTRPTVGGQALEEDAQTIAVNLPRVPGYQIAGEIGRGGMGVVYRARDLTIGREVALKFLLERYRPHSPTALRFLDEARITGQLQHPGIPAIHQIGALPDGRPYLAMKLIKGRTLDSLLQHAPSVPLNKLAIFEAICQAVGYAHAHRVIHRDLKPANVMVGSFGEVQVMDWGLAKVLPKAGESAAANDTADGTTAGTEIHGERDSDTQAGSMLGTPACMPPEQAAGELERIGQRSDVFSLGAILCVMLTGKGPYRGNNVETVRLAAVRGRLEEAYAQLDASGGEPKTDRTRQTLPECSTGRSPGGRERGGRRGGAVARRSGTTSAANGAGPRSG